jgi:hypothetical protein
VLVLGCFEVVGTEVAGGLDGEEVCGVAVVVVVGSWLGFSGGVSKSCGVFLGRCFAFHCVMHREGKRRRSLWIC